MKKIRITGVAVIFGIICFAFTKQKFNEGIGCNEILFWFRLNGNLTCGQVTLQSQLQPILDTDCDGLLTALDILPMTASFHPYGCMDTQPYACCLGYRLSLNPLLNQVETFLESGELKFRPIQSKIPLYRCCVKKPFN
jgi:hypothetical protein